MLLTVWRGNVKYREEEIARSRFLRGWAGNPSFEPRDSGLGILVSTAGYWVLVKSFISFDLQRYPREYRADTRVPSLLKRGTPGIGTISLGASTDTVCT